jgi:hypothetical protein
MCGPAAGGGSAVGAGGSPAPGAGSAGVEVPKIVIIHCEPFQTLARDPVHENVS